MGGGVYDSSHPPCALGELPNNDRGAMQAVNHLINTNLFDLQVLRYFPLTFFSFFLQENHPTAPPPVSPLKRSTNTAGNPSAPDPQKHPSRLTTNKLHFHSFHQLAELGSIELCKGGESGSARVAGGREKVINEPRVDKVAQSSARTRENVGVDAAQPASTSSVGMPSIVNDAHTHSHATRGRRRKKMKVEFLKQKQRQTCLKRPSASRYIFLF